MICKVRKGGQGKKGFKRPVLFPKLTFLYDENLHTVVAILHSLSERPKCYSIIEKRRNSIYIIQTKPQALQLARIYYSRGGQKVKIQVLSS